MKYFKAFCTLGSTQFTHIFTSPLKSMQHKVDLILIISDDSKLPIVRPITKIPRHNHIKPDFKNLHWLPVEQRITFETSHLIYKILQYWPIPVSAINFKVQKTFLFDRIC